METKISALTIILIILSVILIYFTFNQHTYYNHEYNSYSELLDAGPNVVDINFSLPQEKIALLKEMKTHEESSHNYRLNMYLSYMNSARLEYIGYKLSLIIFIFLSILSWRFDLLNHAQKCR